MKVHVGCGSVYLDGWINIDVPGPKTYLAGQRPDLVERLKTDESDYYARHKDKTQTSLAAGPLDQEAVCDKFGSFDNLPIPSWSATEILTRHVFEHLSVTEARQALDVCDEVLQENGILRIDVPDHERSLELFAETKDPFYKRHILGPRRNDYGYHLCGYTRERLIKLVEEHGFLFSADEPNPHFYPAICLKFIKPGPRAPRDYAWPPPYAIPDNWKVLEVGPGNYPLRRADAYADLHFEKLAPLQAQGKRTIKGNIEDGFPQVRDKEFDFVWCSHVLEHVDNPMKAAQTLSRIAKRGRLILPSAFKEGMFAAEEYEHQWQILPGSCACSSPVFVKYNPDFLKGVRDTEVQKIASRLYRTGPNRIDPEQRYLRRWYYEKEAALDVIYDWEGELKLQVIQ